MNKRKLSREEVRQLGFVASHEEAENGDQCHGLVGPNYFKFTTTCIGPKGRWDNAHHNERTQVIYIVQDGKMALAKFDPHKSDGGLKVSAVFVGDKITTERGVAHNVYYFPNTIVHAVNFYKQAPLGKPKIEVDWHPSPTLHKATVSICEADIEAYIRRKYAREEFKEQIS